MLKGNNQHPDDDNLLEKYQIYTDEVHNFYWSMIKLKK